MGKKRLKRRIIMLEERISRVDSNAEELFAGLAALWQWDGDPAVRELILQHVPNFKTQHMFHMTDALLKEWYMPAFRQQMEPIDWDSISNSGTITSSAGEPPGRWRGSVRARGGCEGTSSPTDSTPPTS